MFFLILSFPANAQIVYQSNVKITQINAYDDVPNTPAFIFLSSNHAACPKGVYLNSSAVHFDSLYALVLSAFIAGKRVTFQIYDDRLKSERCEVDAIQVFAS